MSSFTKRACDACHRRKVRCNGAHPCNNCTQAALSCTFNKPPQKKGPKGSRAKVISELRETQKLSETPLPFKGYDSPMASPTSSRTPGLLSSERIDTCVAFYFAHLYPTLPVMNRGQLQDTVMEVHSSIEAYCTVGALCAFIIIQPGINILKSQELYGEMSMAVDPERGLLLLEEIIRLRKGFDYIDNPTTNTVITSYFISACYFGLDKHNTAWFHLREASTLAQNLGMQDEESYIQPGMAGILKRRLYWSLFVSERAYVLHKHKPLTFFATIKLPTLDEDPSEAVAITSFIHLVNLFRPFDDKFVGVWNKTRSDCSASWLAQKQDELTAALPPDMECTEMQASDLRITQQWLRTIVWQLSIANGCLSSTSSNSYLTFSYPIEIARDLVSITGQLSQLSMEVHGIGLIEKLFDVACTLTDVMSCVPIETASFESGPQDYLHHFLHLISTLRGGESRYVPLLLAKIKDTLPTMAASFTHPLGLNLSMPRRIKYEESSESSDSAPFSSPPFSVASAAELAGPPFFVTSAAELAGITTSLPALSFTSGPSVIIGLSSMPPSIHPYPAHYDSTYHG